MGNVLVIHSSVWPLRRRVCPLPIILDRMNKRWLKNERNGQKSLIYNTN